MNTFKEHLDYVLDAQSTPLGKALTWLTFGAGSLLTVVFFISLLSAISGGLPEWTIKDSMLGGLGGITVMVLPVIGVFIEAGFRFAKGKLGGNV